MALSVFLQAWRIRRVARLYAVRLPGLLVQDYGASETYNDAQITACVRRAKLPPEGLTIARAAFLPEAEYAEKYGGDQAVLSKLFKESLPDSISDTFHSPQENAYVMSGGGGNVG